LISGEARVLEYRKLAAAVNGRPRTGSRSALGSIRDGVVRRLVEPVIDWRNSRQPGRKTVYLHIGAHKTGTTAIQALLADESRRLRWHGFYFDRDFYRLGKTLASQSPLSASDRDRIRREVNSRLQARPEPNTIGSSEAFFGDLFRSYANNRAVAQDVRAILADFDVRIVACVRRQDDFVQSVYQQHVKQGGTQRFDAFINSHDIHAYRWDELLGHYRTEFGRSALGVYCYEDLFQTDNAILECLFPALAATGFRSVSRAEVRNPSLSAKGLEIALRCNELLNGDEQRALRHFVEGAFTRSAGESHTLFTLEQRYELLAFYAASNIRCFEEFLDRVPNNVSYVPEVVHAVVA
jgi:hypothetical protein